MEPNIDDHRPGLKPPRFSLATLLIVVGVLGVLFAAMSYVGPFAAMMLTLFILTVAAHIAGNAIGTQLRDNGNRRPVANEVTPRRKLRPIAETDFAPPSQLHLRSGLGTPIVITTAIGSAAAAVLGGYGLTTLMERPNWLAISLGIIASGVLGGIWTFVASSFLQVASSALRQAAREVKH